jgi:Polymerase beta, Nucleotidyltransferase
MRLSQLELKSIITTIKKNDPEAEIYLYGSRTDDYKHGGDIDIAIVSDIITQQEIRNIRLTLYNLIGEQKIDIISGKMNMSPFLQKAVETGVLLNGKS